MYTELPEQSRILMMMLIVCIRVCINVIQPAQFTFLLPKMLTGHDAPTRTISVCIQYHCYDQIWLVWVGAPCTFSNSWVSPSRSWDLAWTLYRRAMADGCTAGWPALQRWKWISYISSIIRESVSIPSHLGNCKAISCISASAEVLVPQVLAPQASSINEQVSNCEPDFISSLAFTSHRSYLWLQQVSPTKQNVRKQ